MPDLAQQIRDRCSDGFDVVRGPKPYRAAVLSMIDLHWPIQNGKCVECLRRWPCNTVGAIATALGIEVSRG